MIEAEHEDLAVADLAGLRGRGDGLDDLVDLIGSAGDFQLDLRQKAHGIFGAAVDFGVALLAPVAFHLGDGQSLNANLAERITDLVELERLDDGHDNFHWFNLPVDYALRSSEQRQRTRAEQTAPHPTLDRNQAACQFGETCSSAGEPAPIGMRV